MKSTELKKRGRRPTARQTHHPKSAPTAAPAILAEETDSATVPPAPKQMSPTAGKSPDPARLSFDLERYRKHDGAIAVIMGSYQLRHLNRFYREFDGNLVLPIILGEIGHFFTATVRSPFTGILLVVEMTDSFHLLLAMLAAASAAYTAPMMLGNKPLQRAR